jgi:hypothetical protein
MVNYTVKRSAGKSTHFFTARITYYLDKRQVKNEKVKLPH